MKFKSKRIYLNTKRDNYCTLRLYADKKEMCVYYNSYCRKYDKAGEFAKILGASLHYTIIKKGKLSPHTGMVLLNVNNCGAGVVSHELLHAVLYAYKIRSKKNQYPIIIKNMKQEEEILHNHTYAVTQFYKWYWKVVEKIK